MDAQKHDFKGSVKCFSIEPVLIQGLKANSLNKYLFKSKQWRHPGFLPLISSYNSHNATASSLKQSPYINLSSSTAPGYNAGLLSGSIQDTPDDITVTSSGRIVIPGLWRDSVTRTEKSLCI